MKNYFVFFALIISFSTIAQQKEPQPAVSNEIKTDLKPVRQATSVSYPVYSTKIDENDEYYGRKEEFSQMFVSNVLPLDFPKFQTGSDVDDYKLKVKLFFKENVVLLKDVYKEKYSN